MENSSTTEQGPENNSETIFTPEELSTAGYDKHIRQARNAIFVAAGILALTLLQLYRIIMTIYGSICLYGDCLLWASFFLHYGQKRNLIMQLLVH